MLRSNDILKLIGPATAGTSTMHKGGALFLANKGSNARDWHTPAQRQFLDDVGSQSVTPPQSYAHPAAGPQPHRKDGPLSPVEVAWMTGLPRDPTQVTTADAVVLYAMAQSTGGATSPDGRLVHQLLDPIAAHHDRRAADVAVANARAPIPDVPSSALGALADAVLAENDQLRPEEALARASELIATARTQRVQAREAQIAQAEHSAMVVDAHEVNRTAVSG